MFQTLEQILPLCVIVSNCLQIMTYDFLQSAVLDHVFFAICSKVSSSRIVVPHNFLFKNCCTGQFFFLQIVVLGWGWEVLEVVRVVEVVK